MTNPDVFMWVVGGLAVWNAAMTTVGFSMVQRVARLEGAVSLIGKNAAKVLHSPNNHHGMDKLLDKYINPKVTLTSEEWTQLQVKCEMTLNDQSVSKDERFFAGIVHAMCVARLEYKLPC